MKRVGGRVCTDHLNGFLLDRGFQVLLTAYTLLNRPEQTTLAALETAGFSPSMIDHFFRPFFVGVFLERELETSGRLFEFVFRMFAEGDTALPASGMGAISEQLAAQFPDGALYLSQRVKTVTRKALRQRGLTQALGTQASARISLNSRLILFQVSPPFSLTKTSP